MDDWGAQRNLLIDPAVWKARFKPLYKDYVDIAHKHGKKFFFHSDGDTLAIIPELIDLGVDAANLQIFAIGVDNLAQFKGKITFWGEMDRQHLLPHGSANEIDAAVSKVYDTVWKDGGAIGQCEFGPGANPANVRRLFESWAAKRAAGGSS
jgi:uroporphyrinogen-III decarboxylase